MYVFIKVLSETFYLRFAIIMATDKNYTSGYQFYIWFRGFQWRLELWNV